MLNDVRPAKVLAVFLIAYEAKDICAIDRLLAEGVTLQDWNLAVQGRESVVAEMLKNFNEAESLQLQVRQFYEGDGCAAAQIRIVVNTSVELEVVDAITIDLDGKITSIRAYKG